VPSAWERISSDPVLLARKRASAKLTARRLYERLHPDARPYMPGCRGRTGPRIETFVRRWKRQLREFGKQESWRAKHLFLMNQVPGCLEPVKCKGCKKFFPPEQRKASTRRCRSCELAYRKTDRVRLSRRLSKHARRARERSAGGVVTIASWTSILQRWGGSCARCGASGDLTMDHIIPLARGGSNDPSNIQPMCHWCNSTKGAVMTGAVQACIPGILYRV
jgi:5-methylcytosine-specific restriction endonuclease McrA